MQFQDIEKGSFSLQKGNFSTSEEPHLHCNSSRFAMQKGLPYLPKVFHLDCKKALLDEKHGIRHLRYIPKNASENSRIDFSFVTDFYCMYDICMWKLVQFL